jgi:hypothetical protein
MGKSTLLCRVMVFAQLDSIGRNVTINVDTEGSSIAMESATSRARVRPGEAGLARAVAAKRAKSGA